VKTLTRVTSEVGAVSDAGRKRLLSLPGEPLFIANWDRTLMIHYEVEPSELRAWVPFELDTFEGRTFVTLVAFTLSNMRPRIGGKVAALFCKPIASHPFLNVRTYVRHNGESGIYFLAEWLSNRLSVFLGPKIFGLPYRAGRLGYYHDEPSGRLQGSVTSLTTEKFFAYDGQMGNAAFHPCAPGTLDEWLMERYTAFTCVSRPRRFFRVWHPPWEQVAADIEVTNKNLLDDTWPFFRTAEMIGANYSPGATDVWMGWPHRVTM
jgi:uncharacterized protein YqjF (DUF2071 family)